MSSAVAERLPRERATTYPVLGKIMADVRIEGTGCQMSAERFRYWARHLAEHYPYERHAKLYQMLGGMTLEMARFRAFGAIQLYALATLGLPVHEGEELAETGDFVATLREHSNTLGVEPTMTRPASGRAMAPPTRTGVSARGNTTQPMGLGQRTTRPLGGGNKPQGN